MSWEEYKSRTYNIPFWYNPKTGKSVWENPDDASETKVKTCMAILKMPWVKYTSRTYNIPFWYNSKTGESVWENPDDVSKNKVVATNTEENIVKNVKKKVKTEIKYEKNTEDDPCSIFVVSGNGMCGSIRCASNSHYDQMEAIRDLNESMRDLYR